MDMERCISACTDCHQACLSTAAHCLERGGQHAERKHITLLLDCAQICQTSADFMLRGSADHKSACAICAEICIRCAEDCERFADDGKMQECARACRSCAASCEKMAGQQRATAERPAGIA